MTSCGLRMTTLFFAGTLQQTRIVSATASARKNISSPLFVLDVRTTGRAHAQGKSRQIPIPSCSQPATRKPAIVWPSLFMSGTPFIHRSAFMFACPAFFDNQREIRASGKSMALSCRLSRLPTYSLSSKRPSRMSSRSCASRTSVRNANSYHVR